MRLFKIAAILLWLAYGGCQTTPATQEEGATDTPTANGASPADPEAESPDPDTPQKGVDLDELRKRRYWHYWHRSINR